MMYMTGLTYICTSGTLPCLTMDGKIILESKNKVSYLDWACARGGILCCMRGNRNRGNVGV